MGTYRACDTKKFFTISKLSMQEYKRTVILGMFEINGRFRLF